MKDLLNNIDVRRVLSPVSVADTTAQVGQIIDVKGFSSITFLIAAGALADVDATFAVSLDESDAADMSGSNAVAATDLIGTLALASFTFADDDKVRKLGYRGTKRYVRLTITPAANASAALMSALVVLGHPALAPTANPPA